MSKPKNLDKMEIDNIIKDYIHFRSLSKVSKKYLLSASFIYRLLKNNNIDTKVDKIKAANSLRKYVCDEDYFEEINTRDKAYITGLLHSDGFINIKSRQVRLKLTDLDLVKSVADKICIDRKLYSDSSIKKEHKPNLSFVVTSQKFMDDCIKHGCVHNKTFNLDFPITISDEFMGDYLRGMFDGDGHIGINRKLSYKPANFKIVATRKWIDKAIVWLSKNNIMSKFYDDRRHNDKLTGLHITDNISLIKFYNLIYNNVDNEMFLKRKYDVYTEFVNFKKQLNKLKYDKVY